MRVTGWIQRIMGDRVAHGDKRIVVLALLPQFVGPGRIKCRFQGGLQCIKRLVETELHDTQPRPSQAGVTKQVQRDATAATITQIGDVGEKRRRADNFEEERYRVNRPLACLFQPWQRLVYSSTTNAQ